VGRSHRLATAEPPYIVQLPRRAGQKEVRYAHLLSGTRDVSEDDEEQSTKPSGALEARVVKLETELAELKEAFDKLMKELM